MVRTDLNNFSEQEIDALIRHGYTHARRSCVNAGLVRDDCKNSMWSPVKAGLQTKANDLDGSEKQPLWGWLLGWDRYAAGNFVLIFLWLMALGLAGNWLLSHFSLPSLVRSWSSVHASFQDQHVKIWTWSRRPTFSDGPPSEGTAPAA